MARTARGARPYPTPSRDAGGREPADAGAAGAGRAPRDTGTGGVVATDLLTPRQLDVLRLVALGLTNQRVAAALGMSPSTVKEHLAAIYRRLGVQSRTGAVVALWRAERGD